MQPGTLGFSLPDVATLPQKVAFPPTELNGGDNYAVSPAKPLCFLPVPRLQTLLLK